MHRIGKADAVLQGRIQALVFGRTGARIGSGCAEQGKRRGGLIRVEGIDAVCHQVLLAAKRQAAECLRTKASISNLKHLAGAGAVVIGGLLARGEAIVQRQRFQRISENAGLRIEPGLKREHAGPIRGNRLKASQADLRLAQVAAGRAKYRFVSGLLNDIGAGRRIEIAERGAM